MDKASRNFDAKNATKDRYGNITAKNQHGIVPRKLPDNVWMEQADEDEDEDKNS